MNISPTDLFDFSTPFIQERKLKGQLLSLGGVSSVSYIFGLKFELEHWGHRKLQSLFLETLSLCLRYYPELVPDDAARKKTIKDTRNRYNDNLDTLYSNIEFVGVSVYKEEATRGVPMQDIYIPLTVVPERADETNPGITSTNPLSFLAQGARHVVLGDPGPGKSTLLKFLTFLGHSELLQKRYGGAPDERLPSYMSSQFL